MRCRDELDEYCAVNVLVATDSKANDSTQDGESNEIRRTSAYQARNGS
jgi:hypothetical protein